jgi:hypothetical protein
MINEYENRHAHIDFDHGSFSDRDPIFDWQET